MTTQTIRALSSSPRRLIRALFHASRAYLSDLRLLSPEVRSFLLANALFGLGTSFFAVLLNLLLERRGFSRSLIGDVQGAMAIGTALMSIPAALVYGRVSTRLLLVASAILGAVCFALQAMTGDPLLLKLSALGAGAAGSVHGVAAGPFLMRHSGERERIHAFSLTFAVEVIASVLGVLCAGWIPRLLKGTPPEQAIEFALYIGAGIVALSALPYASLGKATGESSRASGFFGPLRSWGRLGLYVRMILPDTITGLGAGITIPFLNLYLQERFQLGTAGVGSVFAFVNAFMVTGILAGPLLGHRLGLLRTVASTQLLSIPFMLALALTFDVRIAVAALMVRAALMNLGHPLARAFQMQLVTSEERATVNSLSSLCWSGSWVLGTTLGGRLIESQGFTVSIFWTAGIYLVSTCLYLYFWRGGSYWKIGRR